MEGADDVTGCMAIGASPRDGEIGVERAWYT
jgi:hypothetical protein